MEEMRNESIESIETTTEFVPEDNSGVTENTSDGKTSAITLIAIGGIAAGAVALWRKTKNIRREHAIKKLEKEGYTVYEPADDFDDDFEDAECVSEEKETEE